MDAFLDCFGAFINFGGKYLIGLDMDREQREANIEI